MAYPSYTIHPRRIYTHLSHNTPTHPTHPHLIHTSHTIHPSYTLIQYTLISYSTPTHTTHTSHTILPLIRHTLISYTHTLISYTHPHLIHTLILQYSPLILLYNTPSSHTANPLTQHIHSYDTPSPPLLPLPITPSHPLPQFPPLTPSHPSLILTTPGLDKSVTQVIWRVTSPAAQLEP